MKTLKLLTWILIPALALSCDSDSEDAGPPPPAADKCTTVTVPNLAMCFSFNGTANERLSDDQAIVNGASLTTDRNGSADAAYAFDGIDDFISISNPTYQLDGDFTLSTWIFIDENTPLFGKVRILDTRNPSFSPNNSLNIYIDFSSNELKVAGIGLSRFEFDYGDDVGNWLHIALVYDASELDEKLEAYVNGLQLDINADGFSGHDYANEDMVIGARADIVEVFNGKIDDILIFDRAFEESELVQLLSL